MSIRMMKLVTGEDVIADASIDPYDHYWMVLKKPALVATMPSPTGMGFHMALIPYFQVSDDVVSNKEVKILKQHIMIDSTPIKDVLNEYNRIFGSGIVLA